MAEPRMAWTGKTTNEAIALGQEILRHDSVRDLSHSPATIIENSPANSRSATIAPASDETLQAAARLKILLATGRMAAFSGLTPQDGATPLLIHVGSALASIDSAPILLLDANSRAPMMHKLLGIPQKPGLLDCLGGACSLDAAIRPTTLHNLSVLPFGEGNSNLSLLLSTAEAQQLLAAIRERYRYILVDAGVTFQTSEGVMISSICDGVVIALASGKRRQHEILQCREGLERLNLRLLGIVLTRNSPRL